ncbi:MAG: hypothetical protein U9N77_00460 [Thermodesulfobacteriota bacterium]|nr:hypothetical protein [Thermodesulfobacteriota bacterium]
MKALFKHSNGRLKTSRMALFVFIILLICLSSVYKMGKSADKVLLKIEHVFEAPDKVGKSKEPVARVVKALEHPMPEKPLKIKQELLPDDEPAEPEKKLVPVKEVKQVEKKSKPSEALQTATKSKSQKKATSELAAEKTPVKKQTVEKVKTDKINKPEKEQVRFAQAQDLKLQPELDAASMETRRGKPEILKLPSKAYFKVYRQWQEQGEALDKGKTLVNLRILNLENVYDLFQMKAVAIKNGKPHTDLEDNSRIAKTSLSEFSSTCFIVSNPWEKWGDALKDAGFTKKDNIEVWYYTYEFVRNSIYARAQKAFAWSAAKLNLPEDHDPSKADVLGKVYAVNKAGGGAFGVFVPIQVDFSSLKSVKIDPLACYKGEKDIQALNNAGLLQN